MCRLLRGSLDDGGRGADAADAGDGCERHHRSARPARYTVADVYQSSLVENPTALVAGDVTSLELTSALTLAVGIVQVRLHLSESVLNEDSQVDL